MIVETFNRLDYNSVKDRIVTRVVNAKTESHLLKDRPCSYVKDLAVLYDIEMFHTNGTRAIMQVNNTLFSQWDVTMEELHKNALDATARRNPYVLSNMDDELWGSPVNFLDGADYVNAGMLLVASNEQKNYGANIIADNNMLEKISQVINDDMYILPSSVHELLILPKENAKDLGMTPKALGEMVREVNRTQVEPKERLANHVYEYNRDTKDLMIVNSSREKVMERLGQVIDYATNPEKTSAKIQREYTPEQYQALADVLAYAKDEEKTEQEFYVEGINCNVAIARDQFVTVKEQYGKTEGIQAYHGYLSFKETDISPEMAQKIGMEFANEVWGKRFQVVVTTHLNTKHLHCHFVINSISFVDGKHLWGDEKAWFKFRKVADRICEKYGLYYDPNPNRSKQSEYLTMKEKAGMPTRYSVVKEAIDYAIAHSRTKKEFEYALKEMGYFYNLSPSRKYWTVTPKGYNKPIRLKNLGEDYTNARIEERLRANRDLIDIQPFQRQAYRPRQYRLPTRRDKIKKVGGIYGLYLHYCYRLGYLPKYKKQNNARLHYLLKEDLMKLDQITDEVRLLGKHHIVTAEQLFSYKASVEEKIETLTADRTHLRKKIRTKIDDVELSKAKEEISSITEKLRTLRKEVRLCEGIAERSKVMEKNLEQIQTEEQTIQRKENRNYESRW